MTNARAFAKARNARFAASARITAALAILAVAALLLAASCASAPKALPEPTSADWDAIFARYAERPTDENADSRANVEAFFQSRRDKTIAEARRALREARSPQKTVSGAADAAGYLRAEACLPELEARMLADPAWFIRFACANALDSVDSPESAQAAINALSAETDGTVAMALAMYLSRHPTPGARDALERARARFSPNADERSLLATVFLEDALAALGE
jgi:hypothetical protein